MSSLRIAVPGVSKRQCVQWMSLAFLLLSRPSVCPAAALVINEILASNNSGVTDPQDEYDDWIEIYNPGETAVDVAGMYLTDDLREPTRWRFPTDHPELTRIAPGGFLLLWADGDTADAGLHASFSLRATGEEIGLFDVDGVTLVDSVSFGEQFVDVSYGRYPDGAADWTFMGWPTPGDTNISIYAGAVAPPQLSHARGLCDAAFSLELTTPTVGATIYYRLDGGDPTTQTGRVPVGTKYTGPILISRTTCVRASAIKAGWMPSPTVTATYIFLDTAIHQPALPSGFPSSWGSTRVDYEMDPDVVSSPLYASTIKNDLVTIPSVSIAIANDDFFGAQKGIYANTQAHGIEWEKRASIEWIDPVKGDDFQVNAGLRVHGSQYGRTASVAKHSLRILFKNEYGPAVLEYPLFEDSDVDRFDNLVLRGIWNYSWFGDSTACGGMGTSHADYLRDLFARDTVRDLGRLSPRGRPVHLYINGLYWGLYILSERPDDGFAAEHMGANKEDYDVLFANTSMEVVAGDLTAWNTMLAAAGGDLSTTPTYKAFQKLVDVPSMIDYLLMIYYVGSRDAPVLLCNDQVPRNFYTLRRRNPAGPFLFVPWDVEWILESPTVNRVRIVGQANPHYLLNRLSTNADFRVLLADHIYERFFHDGELTASSGTARYMARADEIDRAIVGESARWGDSLRSSSPYTRADWLAERDRLVNQYFSVRTDIVLDQLQQAGLYPSISPPDFLVNSTPKRGGNIGITDRITLTASPATAWYTLDGSDPRVPGTAASDELSLTWVGEDAAKKVLVPAGPVDDAWRGGANFYDSAWIGGAGGVGFERSSGYEQLFRIDVLDPMYGHNASCYIRIPFDVSAEDYKDLASLYLKVRYDDAFVAYLNGEEVQRALFDGTPAWNSIATSNHNDSDAVNFETFDLSAHIGKIRRGQNVLAIQGLNAGTTSSDFLISVELTASKRPAGGVPTGVSPAAVRYEGSIPLSVSSRIKVRALSGSIWSALNEAVFAVGPVAENLRISEIMYHPAETGDPNDPNTEYIELTNIGAQTINLSLVQFTNGVEFTFPSFDLAPGGGGLVVKDIAAFEARYSAGLPVVGQYEGSLSNAGERIELRDAAGNLIHDFRFEDSWYPTTDGDGFSLVVKDPETTDPNTLADKAVWRPSTHKGGSPGSAD
ncbi:MAG: lamin tail domain-containing protein [Sedimentisphaerales bacterium]|nr:lamin tail domain-containing protein [Sedimentisphaerales bacterium]